MDNWKDVLLRHWSYLIDNLNIGDVVDELYQGVDGRSLITALLYDTIKTVYTTRETNELYLRHLKNSGTIKSLIDFIAILRATPYKVPVHKEIADRLESDPDLSAALHGVTPDPPVKYSPPVHPSPQFNPSPVNPPSVSREDGLNVAEHMAELQTKVIHKVPGKWRDIAIQLKFTFNATEKIKGESEEERCQTMLGAWLRRNKQTGDLPRTRGSLYDALVSADCREEAEALLRRSVDYRLPVKPTEAKKRSWVEEQEAVKQTKVFEKIVTLDVGGTKYRTSLATLKGHPESMLGIMFSGRHSLEQQMDGSYFIDRDGDTFKYVIMYLRDPVTAFLAIPSLQNSTRQLIRYEAHFFQLNELERYCQTTLQRYVNLSLELKNAIGQQHSSCEYNPSSRFPLYYHLSGEYAGITFGHQLIGSKIDATFRHCDLSNVTFKECLFVKDPCFEGCVLFNTNFESVEGLIRNKVHFTPWQIQQAIFEPELLDALKKNELIY